MLGLLGSSLCGAEKAGAFTAMRGSVSTNANRKRFYQQPHVRELSVDVTHPGISSGAFHGALRDDVRRPKTLKSQQNFMHVCI